MSETQFIGASLLVQSDIVIEKVILPNPYKGHIFVKTMSGEAWDDYQDTILVKDENGDRQVDLKQSKAKMLVHCLCNEEGELIFSGKNIDALTKKSNRLLEVLAKVAQRLNGMGEDSPAKN